MACIIDTSPSVKKIHNPPDPATAPNKPYLTASAHPSKCKYQDPGFKEGRTSMTDRELDWRKNRTYHT